MNAVLGHLIGEFVTITTIDGTKEQGWLRRLVDGCAVVQLVDEHGKTLANSRVYPLNNIASVAFVMTGSLESQLDCKSNFVDWSAVRKA